MEFIPASSRVGQGLHVKPRLGCRWECPRGVPRDGHIPLPIKVSILPLLMVPAWCRAGLGGALALLCSAEGELGDTGDGGGSGG